MADPRPGAGVLSDRRRPRPELLFAAAAVSQYLGAALAVTLFDRIPAGGVAWLRVASAAVVLLVWRRPRPTGKTSDYWLRAGAFGVALAAMNLTFYLSIDRIPVGTAVAIEFWGPVAVAAFGSRRRRDWAALGLAVVGVGLVADVRITHSAAGVGLALVAGGFWALYVVLGHRVAGAGRGLDSLAAAMAIGALAIAPVAAADAGPAFGGAGLLAAAVGVGLLSSVVPYGIDQLTLRRLARHRFAVLLALLPATATVVGAVVLGQVPGATELAGIAVVMGAIALSQDASGDAAAGGGVGVGLEQDNATVGI